jgi:hypothetical protein
MKKIIGILLTFFLIFLEIPQTIQFFDETSESATLDNDVDVNIVLDEKILSRQKRNFGGTEQINFPLVSIL